VRPPEWIWIALSVPTLISCSVGVGLVALWTLRDLAWRRRQRRRAQRPLADVIELRRPADRDAGVWNGGARRP
jgi:hypothetical protein